VNRILRTRLGPLGMDRSLARGVHRALTEGEIEVLREAAGVRRPAVARVALDRPGRSRAPSAGRSSRRPGGRRAPN